MFLGKYLHNTKSTDTVAQKDNSPLEKCPGHGNVKIGVFRPRRTFWEEYFIFLSHMWQDIFQGSYSWKIRRKSQKNKNYQDGLPYTQKCS